jgi:hypothetical protein
VAVRAAATRALGARALGDSAERERALAALRRLADAAEPATSVPALESLGRLGDADDDGRFIHALGSADTEAVKVAARALGARPDSPLATRAREALWHALGDTRWDVRRAAAEALGHYGASAHALLEARRQLERDALVLEAIEAALGRERAGEGA